MKQGMNQAGPFRPATVLAMLLIGGLAFMLLLYAIGAGLDGHDDRDGGAHAASNGLTGFSALADLLERRGHEVSLSRSPAGLEEEDTLLVITPQHFADGEDIWEVITDRRYIGPTIIILPKWYAAAIPQNPTIKSEPGWVMLGLASEPGWLGELEGLADFETVIGQTKGWRGLGLSGDLPVSDQAQASRKENGAKAGLLPLITDSEGDLLAGYWDDGGYYPILAVAAGLPPPSDGDELDEDAWPVVIVIEPDLMNNYGLADQTRARAAVSLIDTTLEDYDLPIIFDLTIPGLGHSENLLTLAFRPPFLAATLCLMLTAAMIGWRAFRRFGPLVAAEPPMAMGKRQLARNGASLIERARRLHLLGPPYAAMVSARIAHALGVRETDIGLRDAAITRALAMRGYAYLDYQGSAHALREARKPGELLRAAMALRTIERTVTQ